MTTTKTLLATMLLLGVTGANGAALAGNAGASLGACVDHVVETCNANAKRPALCAKGGIKACETLHSGKKKPTAAAVLQSLKTAGVPQSPRPRTHSPGALSN